MSDDLIFMLAVAIGVGVATGCVARLAKRFAGVQSSPIELGAFAGALIALLVFGIRSRDVFLIGSISALVIGGFFLIKILRRVMGADKGK